MELFSPDTRRDLLSASPADAITSARGSRRYLEAYNANLVVI